MLPLDPQLVFDRFVVGGGNRLAAAAARRAAESPGRSYNPLVITGPSGRGKTHLLLAVGHLARALEPELRVSYETLDAFVDRLTACISEGTLEEFRAVNAQLDLVLLDDLQQVAGKGRTQEELLRGWEELIGRGAQLVVSSDRPLQEIPALDARLATRLAGGLIVDIAAPDAATRAAILRQLVEDRGVVLPAGVVEALSHLPIDNIRELQGALNRVLAAAEIEERQLDATDVPALLGLDGAGEPAATDEFGSFLTDISTAVAAVVATEPWKRRLAAAILQWEGEGVRTRRLEAALDADSAPDVEALLGSFARDVSRLREIERELPPGVSPDPTVLRDPDRLAEAEAMLEAARGDHGTAAPAPGPEARPAVAEVVDRWFMDREKLDWRWMALDERIVEEQR